MGKLKTAIVLMLTLCLIVVCALLPVMVGAIQDSSAKNHAGHTAIKSVALNISSAQSLSTVEKLILLNNNNSYTISEKEAKMTATQALSCVQTHIEHYIDAGLLPYLEAPYSEYQTTPALCIDDTTQAHCVVWAVHIENSGSNLLTAIVDDDTGIILSIEFHSYEQRYDLTPEEKKYIIDVFTDLFLNQSNLNDISIKGDIAPNYEEPPQGADYLSRYYSLTDEAGNEVVIVFQFDPLGSFYTYFS